MPFWKWLVVAGLASSPVGSVILVWKAGVPGVLPSTFTTHRDVWVWRAAFALMALGTGLQLLGAILSP